MNLYSNIKDKLPITKSAISQLEKYNFTLPIRHLDWTHKLDDYGKHGALANIIYGNLRFRLL